MSISEEIIEAGHIAAEIRRKIGDLVYPGKSIYDLCEEIEGETRKRGGSPAFPCNVGINEIAAHYTSGLEDETKIPNEGIVKVDFGVHINGYIADTAVSIPLSTEYSRMVRAVEDALNNAIVSLGPRVKPKNVGEVIEKTIKMWGYKPIRNLMGHKMERFALHAGNSIPNVADFDGIRIVKGEIYAVEPFLTTSPGKGVVTEMDLRMIYKFQKEKKVKNSYAKKLVKIMKERFYTLPFTLRWLKDESKESDFKNAFRELVATGCVKGYRVLVEEMKNPVAQAEHTVLITETGCDVLTD